jgi:hypothetical protein
MIENGGARSKVSITFYMGLIGQRSGDSKATKIAAKLFADIYPSRESTQVFFVADITHAPQRILGLGPRLSDTSVCYGIFNAPVLVLRRALSPTTEPRRQTAESLLRHFSQRDKAHKTATMADNDAPVTLRTRKFIRNPLLGRKQFVV